jgi:SRSO17 transposase
MNEPLPETGERRLQAYLARLAEVVGHADRRERVVGYCTGLLLPGERKSVEPMAARLDPARVSSLHQALHHFVATAPWSDAAVLAAVREQVLPALTRHGPAAAWIIDDTAFPKKGKHSVGVARQYCGQLGKRENCQVAVTLSVANERASLPVAFDLYLPEDWAGDPARRAEAGVPQDLAFRTKPRIALGQIRRALADGVPPGVVLGDAGYGIDTDFRTALTASALPYVLGVQSTIGVWPPGCGPLPPEPWSGRGRPPKLRRRDPEHQPLTAKDLAFALPPSAWRMVGWREGSRGELSGRFAAVRVRPSHRDYWRAEPHPEEWLLVEWPEAKEEPTKCWLSTLPETAPIEELVATAKLRWRIERDYQELKQELGLDHYEGRGWRGFHHHATLCIAAYGFLVRERSLFPLRSASAATRLRYPRAGGPEGVPSRPERHDPHSIASVRRLLAIALARRLPRCPCCQLPVRPSVPVPQTSLLVTQ